MLINKRRLLQLRPLLLGEVGERAGEGTGEVEVVGRVVEQERFPMTESMTLLTVVQAVQQGEAEGEGGEEAMDNDSSRSSPV